MENESEEQELRFEELVRKIRQIFCEYNPIDIMQSLFISNMWIPNIASPIQHQLLYAVFLSINPQQFKSKYKSNSYKEFVDFLNKIYPLLPSLPSIEDFIPRPDWGEIKFHHKEKDYKIFYGNEFENIYDYMMSFQMMYSSLNEKYIPLNGRSPDLEIEQALTLQDEIISNIDPRVNKKDVEKITNGYKEIPSSKFWEEGKSFFTSFKPHKKFTDQFLKQYSIKIGGIKPEKLTFTYFFDHVFKGDLITTFFIQYQRDYFLLLPRRALIVILDNWNEEFKKYSKVIDGKNTYYTFHLNLEIYQFLKKRISSNNLFGMATALDEKGKATDMLFASAFISKKRLILIYVVPPFYKESDIKLSLEKISPKLIAAQSSIAKSPRLGLNIRKEVVGWESKKSHVLEPFIFVVLSPATTQATRIAVPKDLPGETVFMHDFLAMMDEVEGINEVSDFIDNLKKTDKQISFGFAGLFDKFSAYKKSAGVLIEGAIEPTMILLDPHFGGDFRYKSLKKFWELYPINGFYDHPRTWKPKKETPTRIRLEAKTYFGSSLYCRIGKTEIFFTAPFDFLSYNEGLISNLLMETLEDTMSDFSQIIKEHKFFKRYYQFQINIFPYKLASKEPFLHLARLNPRKEYWKLEKGFIKPSIPAIRVVIDDEKIMKRLDKITDRTVEIEFVTDILWKINEFIPDTKISAIIKKLEEKKRDKPRFKAFSIRKDISFPEFISPLKPTSHDYKLTFKKIAELALSINLTPGKYKLAKAEVKLNELRKKLVQEINGEVSQYKYGENIPFLLERIDALNHDYYRKKESVERSKEHQVDYVREENFSKEHGDYIGLHRDYRYLIEKFVQLVPAGNKDLDSDAFKYLIALVNKLHELYATSDSIHYEIYPAGIKINRDFGAEVKYGVDLHKLQKIYGEEQARIDLGLIGNDKDRVDTAIPIEEYINKLDKAFMTDFGFSLSSLIGVLKILSLWPAYSSKAKEEPSYSSEIKDIETICLKNVKKITSREMPLILDFLTLKSKDVDRISRQKEKCEDIPVWEHFKRYSRYNIRPLIKIKNNYNWGPHSVIKAVAVWSSIPRDIYLPADISCPNVIKVLNEEHKDIEASLAKKALEITKRYFSKAEPNVNLHKRDKKSGYPEELGDYDTLGFNKKKNIVLNLEAKEIDPAYCLKDSKRIKEKIFGRSNKEKGYLKKVENRAEYLKTNMTKIAKTLDWEINPKNPPKIISVFVSRQMYWWTKFPIRETAVKFIRIDLLSDLIKKSI